MPKEVHYLLFSRDELRECLVGYVGTQRAADAHGFDDIEEVSLVTGPDRSVTAQAKLRRYNSKEREERTFTADDIVSAILLFCRRRRIPLAQRAHKMVEALGDQVALMMTVDFPKQSPSVSGQDIRYTGTEAEEARGRVRPDRPGEGA